MVHRAVPVAVRQLGRQVHAPALIPLSNGDRAFLAAMSIDDGPSDAIAERLGDAGGQAATHRLRLIDAELIHPVGPSSVAYTIPYTGQFLRSELPIHTPSLAGGPSADRNRNTAGVTLELDV